MIDLIKNDDISCLVLFGSHATNDADEDSDIDLLGINKSTLRTVRENGKVNLSLYSLDELSRMAESGNIFILHIILEGICIFNPTIFNELKDKFKYKDNYNIDIATAFYLATVILREKDNISNWVIANKRISWCVRTILISISVQNRKPLFSKSKLASSCIESGLDFEESFSLIDAKSNKERNDKILDYLACFLDNYKDYNEEIVRSNFSSGIVVATLDSIFTTPPLYDE